MDAQEDILEDVVGVGLTVHAARDEGPQAVTKLRPDLLGVTSRYRAVHRSSRLAAFAYWHPQLAESPSPQQDAFSVPGQGLEDDCNDHSGWSPRHIRAIE